MRSVSVATASLCMVIASLAFAQGKPAPKVEPKVVSSAADSDTHVVETTTYNGWTITCEGKKLGAADLRCSASFTIKDQSSGSILLAWLLSPKAGKIGMEVLTPTGMLLDKGVELLAGPQAKAKKFAYTWCDANQCSAQAVLDDVHVKELSASANSEATLTTVLKDGRALNFKFPLIGLDKVLARLKSH